MCGWFVYFFFFQAEDGIRDDLVTGVQTCALPICDLGSAELFELCENEDRALVFVEPIEKVIHQPRGLRLNSGLVRAGGRVSQRFRIDDRSRRERMRGPGAKRSAMRTNDVNRNAKEPCFY